MRASIAGKVRIFAISFTLILTLLGLLLGGTLAVLSTRAGDASVSASRALAASQLATSIAESRYFASRYAAEGEARMIASAFATLDQARSEIDATIALDGGGLGGRLLAIGCTSESVGEIRLGGHRESHVIGDGARLRAGPYQGVNHDQKKPIKPMT